MACGTEDSLDLFFVYRRQQYRHPEGNNLNEEARGWLWSPTMLFAFLTVPTVTGRIAMKLGSYIHDSGDPLTLLSDWKQN